MFNFTALKTNVLIENTLSVFLSALCCKYITYTIIKSIINCK